MHELTLTDKTRNCIQREDNERDKYAANNLDCISIQKEDAQIKRDIENKLISLMHGTILAFIKFNNFGNRRLNGLSVYFIYSAVVPGVYLSLWVYMRPALIRINTVATFLVHSHLTYCTKWTLFITRSRLLFYFAFRTHSIFFRTVYRLKMALGCRDF